MARFDVYPSPAKGGAGYVLDVQADLLRDLDIRVVVPLLPPERAPKPARGLNPTFEINRQIHLILTQLHAHSTFCWSDFETLLSSCNLPLPSRKLEIAIEALMEPCGASWARLVPKIADTNQSHLGNVLSTWMAGGIQATA